MRIVLFTSVVLLLAISGETASSPSVFLQSELDAAFEGAEMVDLSTSKVNSVVTLRETVKLSPPDEPILVKTFKRESLPEVLKPAFAKPEVAGVTINSRYVAIIHTDLKKEYQDILAHELVHAYISLASPEPLPFWFHEGSAVHFSTDKTRKFYGQPSDKEVGVMVGKNVELTDTYKQKLHSFHYLIEKVGKKRFYEWYKEAVETGNVDARPLLGLEPAVEAKAKAKKAVPVWLIVAAGVVVVAVVVVGIYATRGDNEYL